MALVDAVASSIGVPLWRLFGGASNMITTDITVKFLTRHHVCDKMSILLQNILN